MSNPGLPHKSREAQALMASWNDPVGQMSSLLFVTEPLLFIFQIKDLSHGLTDSGHDRFGKPSHRPLNETLIIDGSELID